MSQGGYAIPNTAPVASVALKEGEQWDGSWPPPRGVLVTEVVTQLHQRISILEQNAGIAPPPQR